MARFLTIVFVDPAAPDPAAAATRLLRRHYAADLSAAPLAKLDGYSPGDLGGGTRAEGGVRPVADLRPGQVPVAAVAPDGRWFDCDGRTDAEWADEWAALSRRYARHLAAAFDCHC